MTSLKQAINLLNINDNDSIYLTTNWREDCSEFEIFYISMKNVRKYLDMKKIKVHRIIFKYGYELFEYDSYKFVVNGITTEELQKVIEKTYK